MFRLLICTLTLVAVELVSAADLPVIRLGALSYGTVNWELDTIKSNGYDKKNGFTLEVVPMGGGDASDIAFLGGEIDVMVSDFLWAAAQRAEGRNLKFIPYSTSVGGIMVKPDSGINRLTDLVGKRIGIAGGPLDKNWLIVRAYATEKFGIDLKKKTDQEFGAPPLMFKSALTGEIDAVMNFWHFQAKAKAAGMKELLSVQEVARELGLNPDTPLLGYIVKGDMDEKLIQGLYSASRSAKAKLAGDDDAWEQVRGRMKPKNQAEFEALRAGFRAGIPQSTSIDEAEVNQMLSLMAELGGSDLVGKATRLPEGLFVSYKKY